MAIVIILSIIIVVIIIVRDRGRERGQIETDNRHRTIYKGVPLYRGLLFMIYFPLQWASLYKGFPFTRNFSLSA